MAVEGKKYPVTALMFHPETQNRHIVGDRVDGSILGKVNSETTDEIHYRVSQHILAQGLKTLETHKFADPEFGKRMEWLNSNIGLTHSGLTSYLPTYGF